MVPDLGKLATKMSWSCKKVVRIKIEYQTIPLLLSISVKKTGVTLLGSPAKGQLVSKGLFGVIVLTQKPTIFSRISALATEKRLDQKNKGAI